MPSGDAGRDDSLTAAAVIRLLDLTPHPEGGHYRETFRDGPGPGGRARGTAIYYLLRAGEVSHWHRLDAAEVWHWYAGAPLELSIDVAHGGPTPYLLGPALSEGQRPQIVVPANAWQSARSLGPWTLAGCTVAPGFEFSAFELAPEGWAPAPGDGHG